MTFEGLLTAAHWDALDALGHWPEPPSTEQWLALTVVGEAEGEPWQGQLAVAWSIVTRARRMRQSIQDTVLDPFDFSTFNTESRRRLAFDTLAADSWHRARIASRAALHGIGPDPSNGADHFLNVAATKAGRADGTLPGWAADPVDRHRLRPDRVTVVIARHTFLRLLQEPQGDHA